MKRLIAAVLLTLALANSPTAQEEKSKHLVLPNQKLLRCKFADCSHLWSESPTEANAVFPKQLVIDMNQACPYGMTALYDKSIRVEDVKGAIDERYGKWAIAQFESSSIKLWRVEPERFAIQLNVADKKDEKMKLAEAGTKRAIYIAFGGASACNVP